MSEFIAVKHSFNAGDLVVLLPGLRKIYQDTGKKTKLYQRLNLGAFYYEGAVHPITHDNIPVCMNQDIFDRMKPLIEVQEYIESFEVWEGQQVTYDIDLTRESKWIPMPSGMIHQWAWALAPEMACDLGDSWLSIQPKRVVENVNIEWGIKKFIPVDDLRERVLVNRTERYINPYITYFFLKDYQDKVVFSGTQHEHKIFCEQWKLDIPLLVTNDFYELAQVIKMCKFGVYNQSLHWHISDSMKCKRILELCPQFPNTFPTGANGYSFYHQKNLEYYFNQLMQ